MVTYVATVHEEGAISAQPLSREMQQVRLRNYSIIQMERPLHVTHKGPRFHSMYQNTETPNSTVTMTQRRSPLGQKPCVSLKKHECRFNIKLK